MPSMIAIHRALASLFCLSLTLAAMLFAAACSSGKASNENGEVSSIVLAAGLDQIPGSRDAPRTGYQVERLGVPAGRPLQTYRVTTPAGEPFSFDVLTRAQANTGAVFVGVAHVADGPTLVQAGPETMAAAGCAPTGTALSLNDSWLMSSGDGFARITISGAIQQEQVFAFWVGGPTGEEFGLVTVALGPASAINHTRPGSGNHPGVVSEQTLYSSDSWSFGMPTIAVSGDRTSVVVYEGDRFAWAAPGRYEMRMQHDAATGAVTGGGSTETNRDSGNWRDHELAALYNVLALGHCAADQVTVKLSFDRGATFAQEVALPTVGGVTRLIDVAMAADYSLAIAFWRTVGVESQLMLVDARPDAFDAFGSPTSFAFSPAQAVFTTTANGMPLITGLAWSEGGDLVVGHAFNAFVFSGGTAVSRTEFRCAVRPFGGEFTDVVVDAEEMISRDPSVAVLGQGGAMRIYYAYESVAGIKLAVSANGGATFGAPLVVGTPGSTMPKVFARQDGLATRVDLLYLAMSGASQELHAARWPVFGGSPREDYRLTTGAVVPSVSAGPPFGPFGGFSYGQRITQVAWFGYDAVLDGDEIVVVVDEETFDAAFLCVGAFLLPNASTTGVNAPTFSAAAPPPLAAGMTEPVPAPDPTHRHQLRLLRLR